MSWWAGPDPQGFSQTESGSRGFSLAGHPTSGSGLWAVNAVTAVAMSLWLLQPRVSAASTRAVNIAGFDH